MKLFSEQQCNDAMEKFFALDKNERLPIPLTLHILLCQDCRKTVRALYLAEKQLLRENRSEESITEALLWEISRRLDITKMEIKPISMGKWVAGGLAVIATILLSVIFTGTLVTDTSLLAAIYLTMGFVLTLYCGLFVAGNIDFFVKQNEKFRSGKLPLVN
jgi:hypothetical protein